jgi:hypothetical protein
VFMSPLLQ